MLLSLLLGKDSPDARLLGEEQWDGAHTLQGTSISVWREMLYSSRAEHSALGGRNEMEVGSAKHPHAEGGQKQGKGSQACTGRQHKSEGVRPVYGGWLALEWRHTDPSTCPLCGYTGVAGFPWVCIAEGEAGNFHW